MEMHKEYSDDEEKMELLEDEKSSDEEYFSGKTNRRIFIKS